MSPFTDGASLAFAAGLGAAVQTGVDTLETVIRDETMNGWQTVADLGINFICTFAGSWIGSKLIPTNSGWFETKEFLSVFMKPYGQKILLQTTIGAGLSGIVNFARNLTGVVLIGRRLYQQYLFLWFQFIHIFRGVKLWLLKIN